MGGAQQLSERMAEKLGEQVRLEEPVVRVKQDQDGVTVTTANGNVYEVSVVSGFSVSFNRYDMHIVRTLSPEILFFLRLQPGSYISREMENRCSTGI